MPFPAETIDGETVQIADKLLQPGASEVFVDVEGNRYTRDLRVDAHKLIPLEAAAPAEEAAEADDLGGEATEAEDDDEGGAEDE